MTRTFLLSIPKQLKRKNGTNTIHIILFGRIFYSIYFVPTTIAGGRALSRILSQQKDMCIGLNLSENPIRRWYASSLRPIDRPTNRLMMMVWRRRQQQRRRQNKSKTSNENILSTSILLQDQEHCEICYIYLVGNSHSMAVQFHAFPIVGVCVYWVYFFIPFARLLSPVRYAAFNKVELCVWMLCNVYLVPAAIDVVVVVVIISPTLNRTFGRSLSWLVYMYEFMWAVQSENTIVFVSEL